MKFSYSAIWADVMALLKRHGALVAAIAGVFLFLPALLLGYFAPLPPAEEGRNMIEAITAHYRENAHWFLLISFVSMIGTLGIMYLVFRPNVTVGGAIAAGAAMFPFYFIASFLASFLIGIGLLLFLVPGIYLFGRLAPLAAVMAAENLRNPIEALRRTWAVTRGKGWAVIGIFLLVGLAGAVLVSVATSILGIIIALALPRELAHFLNLLISTSATTALQVVLILLYAAVYRALVAGAGQAPAADGETTGS
jgi:hypothetical protein